MNMSGGYRNRRQSSPTAEMKKAGRYMTLQNLLTIPKGKKKLPSTASPNWTKTASKKSESVRARERNISGRRSQSPRTTGTITARLRSGEHRGLSTVTGISIKTSRSITEAMHGRGSIKYRLFTKVLLQGRWKRKARPLTDARSTEKFGSGILLNNRFGI